MQTFFLKTRIYTGAEVLRRLGQLSGRVLIVTDGFLASSPLLERVTVQLTGPTEVFSEVTPDPTAELCAKAAAVCRRFQPGAVVAFGGGSPMDTAKAMLSFAYEDAPFPKLVAIPTTAGTGSEVTSFAIVTSGGEKIPLVDERLQPDEALLDAAFLAGVPETVTADTGFDVLSHCAEAVVGTGATAFSSALAESAFAAAFAALPQAVKGTGRDRMLTASCMAGAAFNTGGLGICHSLAHALGGRFHLPHGRLNAILLPAVIGFHAGLSRSWDAPVPPAAEGYARLAKRCGLSTSSPRAAARSLQTGLIRLRESLAMPATLTAAGLDRKEVSDAIPQLAATALQDRCTQTNPRPVNAEELSELLREVL